METGAEMLDRLAEIWAGVGPPVIVFNKSHSGSRILACLLKASGVFMGSDLNESEDAHDMLRLVRPLVEGHYPDYATLLREGDPAIGKLVDAVLAHHLHNRPPDALWGWKLCETLYIVPVLHRLFPKATYLHLIRDGRDVAFSDHVAPEEPFWRKVYFDTDRIESWQGRGLLHRDYTRRPHVYNARHWVNSVTVARHYGAMVGERYLEIHYEDLVNAPAITARRILRHIGISSNETIIADFSSSVTRQAIGKYRRYRPALQREALAVLHPTLEAFGYGLEAPPKRRFPWWR